jgi:hypothetical protein
LEGGCKAHNREKLITLNAYICNNRDLQSITGATVSNWFFSNNTMKYQKKPDTSKFTFFDFVYVKFKSNANFHRNWSNGCLKGMGITWTAHEGFRNDENSLRLDQGLCFIKSEHFTVN